MGWLSRRKRFMSLHLNRKLNVVVLIKLSFTNVYMKNLPEEWDEEKFKSRFLEFGAITSAKLVFDENGSSKRFGFINFHTTAEASHCVAEMNGKDVGNGEPLYVARAQKKILKG
eukprot:TRINITY_DN368_c0_g2_i5.p1 TRINITY_DN368_c0_g2~~TRINITY_DN368_c0_g2_i5.p1  ORF type:complete len:114 (+),score=23.40 TRINITY_DN368_c0_g2_i5:71-412(+)